jgi:hypothetical protein
MISASSGSPVNHYAYVTNTDTALASWSLLDQYNNALVTIYIHIGLGSLLIVNERTRHVVH